MFSWTWNDRIWVGTHISCLCVCRVCLPTWFLSLTNNVENQFWLVFSTTLQYPNFYHSVLSIFDSRRQSVKISTLLLEIKWKSRPRWRQTFVKLVDPTFNVYIIILCLENTLNDTSTTQNWIPGTDNSGLCTYRTPAWSPVFFEFFYFCTRDTLLQKTDKIHDTGSKSGSYHYSIPLFYTLPYNIVVTRVLGLPVRNCADASNNLVFKSAQVSAIDVTENIIFERLYLVSGLRNIALVSSVPAVGWFNPTGRSVTIDINGRFDCTYGRTRSTSTVRFDYTWGELRSISMVGSIDSIQKSVDIDHPGRFIQTKIGRRSISTVKKKIRSTVDIDRQICEKTKKDQWPMVPTVVNNGPRQSSTKKWMVPNVVRNGPKTYTNIDTNPPINRPVG